jgi:hypothetical protein
MRRLDNEGMLPTRVVTGDILLGFLPLSRALLIPHVFFCLSSSPTIRFGSCLHFIPNPLGNDLISIGTLRTHPHNTTSPCVSPPPSPLPSRPLLALLLPPTSATPRSELATPSIGCEVVC